MAKVTACDEDSPPYDQVFYFITCLYPSPLSPYSFLSPLSPLLSPLSPLSPLLSSLSSLLIYSPLSSFLLLLSQFAAKVISDYHTIITSYLCLNPTGYNIEIMQKSPPFPSHHLISPLTLFPFPCQNPTGGNSEIVQKSPPFSINITSGVITTMRPLDRETTDRYQLCIEARCGLFYKLLYLLFIY